MTGSCRSRLPARGFTLIELLVVIAIIATLLTIALPRYFQSLERSKETVLLQDLAVLRECIDRYRADVGVYPDSLQVLVERGYLRRIPEDPYTKSAETWVPTQSSDPELPGIRDVNSGAEGSSRSGIPFRDL